MHREDRETPALVIEVQERDQHEDRSQEGVKEELDRGVDALLAAPYPDDEKHRDQHRLPEDIEQDRIEGREDPVHEPLQDQERGHILGQAVLDHLEARQDHEHVGEGREQDERQRDPVDPEVVFDAEGRDPGHALDELHRVGRGIEAEVERERKRKGGERDRERELQDGGPIAVRKEQHGHAAQDRQPDDEAQEWHRRPELGKRVPRRPE